MREGLLGPCGQRQAPQLEYEGYSREMRPAAAGPDLHRRWFKTLPKRRLLCLYKSWYNGQIITITSKIDRQ